MSDRMSMAVGPFECVLRQVKLPMGLILDEVRLRGDGVTVLTDPFEAFARQAGDLNVVLTAASMQAFLNAEQPGGLRDIEVTLADGKVYVSATKRVLVDVRANAVCTLRVEGGKKVFVELESVDLLGAGAKNLLQSQLDQINPVLDLDQFPIEARIDEIVVAAGAILANGKIAPPA